MGLKAAKVALVWVFSGGLEIGDSPIPIPVYIPRNRDLLYQRSFIPRIKYFLKLEIFLNMGIYNYVFSSRGYGDI